MKSSAAPRSGDSLPALLAMLLGTVVCIVAAGWVIGLTMESLSRPAPTIPALVTANVGLLPVMPEPIERAIFVLLGALVPTALVTGFWLAPRRTAPRLARVRWTLPIVVAALFAFPFRTSNFLEVMFFPTPWTNAHRWQMSAAALLVSIAVIAHSLLSRTKRRRVGLTMTAAAGIAFVLQILPWRIATIGSVTRELTWSVSFDAAIYALSQVVGGKTLLADLPSQYGFFPELIAPLFRVIGLSVLSFTGLFAVLQLVGLCAIALLMCRYVRSGPLAALTFLALLIPTSLFLFRNGYPTELYYQYFPVRFFWPTVALLLFAQHALHPSRALLMMLAVVSGIALVWNLDSGVPVIVSIAASLAAKPLFAERVTYGSFKRPAAFCLVAVTTVTLFFIALRLKAGAPLHIVEALAYQEVFYGSGFGMLPLPMPVHPWQSVLAIYVAGAITALAGWRRRSTNSVYDVLFCGALLGTGLFTYYQGRSHVFCLMMVLWPAMLIGAILTDLALRSVRRREASPAATALAVPFVLFVSLGSIGLASTVPELIKADRRSIATFGVDQDPVIADEVEFMRATRKGRPCLILSQRQGIYYAELGSASPLPGPGLIETILQRDLDALTARVLIHPLECIYIGVGPASETYVDVGAGALMSKYQIAASSNGGNMLLLRPRSRP